jgi:hypothetical protein
LTVIASGILVYLEVRGTIGGTNDQSVTNNSIPQGVMFHRIARGGLSGYGVSTNLVINNYAEWVRVWDQAFCHTIIPCPPTPEVDFSQRTVLAIFVGQKNSLGYQVDVTGATIDDSKTKVSITMTVPGSSCLTGATITDPYDIVDIPKTTGPISFTSKTQTSNC